MTELSLLISNFPPKSIQSYTNPNNTYKHNTITNNNPYFTC